MAQHTNTSTSIKNVQLEIRSADAIKHMVTNHQLGEFCIFADDRGYNLISLHSIIDEPHRHIEIFEEFFKSLLDVTCTTTTEVKEQ